MRTLILFTLSIALLLHAGCGSDKLQTVNVTGTITYDGQPLAGATVNFAPKVEGVGHPAYAITDANGLYKLQTLLGEVDAGTTPGEYDVYITKIEGGATPSGLDGGSSPVRMPAPRSAIPERYGSTATSGLEAVVENKRNNVINFDLTP